MTGLVLLAAGASKRLSKPKQLLKYKEQSLLQRAIDAALKSSCNPIIVVLGANYETLVKKIPAEGICIINNPDWEEGMASSIRLGLLSLQKLEPKVKQVIFTLCDQPFVNAGLIEQLIKEKKISGKKIIACSYKDTIGAPVLFDRFFFDKIHLLEGQNGAKQLLNDYPEEVSSIPFPLGNIDIDRPEDYELLKRMG